MSKDRKNIYTTLLKPTWGIISENPAKLAKFAQEICEQAANFHKEGGKLLILPYQKGQEVITQIVLSLVFSQFFKQGIKIKHFTPTLKFDYNSDLLNAEILLIDNLPLSQGLASILFSNKWQQLIIATGTLEQWEQVQIDVPYRIYDFLSAPIISWQQPFAEDLEIEKKEVGSLNPQEKDVYKEVITLDFLGVSIPIDLLAHSLNLTIKETLDLITFLEEKSLLNWIELESSASLLVSANAPEISQAMLSFLNIQSSDLFDYFREIIQSTETDKEDERYTILNLFQTASSGFISNQNEIFLSRLNLRNLVNECLEKLQEIWAVGDAIEHLLWGKVLENLQLFKRSAEVFDEGLNSNPDNPYLLQAQARMFGNWALLEPQMMGKAEYLFEKLTDETADNPYFLQAQGVFEANRGNFSQARSYFEEALYFAQGEENKAFILTALANLEIEQSNYATAEKRLNKISSNSKSPYIPHLWAKLNFYRWDYKNGDYEKGIKSLKELFTIRPHSIEGWNLIGEIALKRGHWQKAQMAFSKVLQIAPENVPTLRALGDLETDLGRLASEENDSEKAQKHFKQADEIFKKALQVEPYNYIVEVSQNVLFRNEFVLLKKLNKKAEAEKILVKSETALKKLLEKFKKNEFITHNFGELYQTSGLYEKAKTYFAALCDKNKTLPYLVGLAKAEQSLGNVEKTVSILLEAKQISDSSSQKLQDKIRSLNSLAEIWVNLKDFNKAESLLQKSLELDQENSFSLRLCAKIKRELNQTEEAQSLEKKAQDLADKELEDFLMEKE